MIDASNKTRRYILTPEGKAEADMFVEDYVWVWLGEKDNRTKSARPHKKYLMEECYELEE